MATDTSTELRADLHALINALPDSELSEAKRYLAGLSSTDSFERKLLLAPLEDEELSTDEVDALRGTEGRYRGGQVVYVSDEELARALGE